MATLCLGSKCVLLRVTTVSFYEEVCVSLFGGSTTGAQYLTTTVISNFLFTGLTNPATKAVVVYISPAISRYGAYLQGVYSRSVVSSDKKFPPTPSKKYINLAMSHGSRRRDLEDLRKYTLHGRVDELLRGKEKIEIGDILKPIEDDNGELKPVSLVFVEGPPGIGKSSLAWELCRQWDRTQYDLVVLFRLRNREVQGIKKVHGLFPYRYDQELQRSVAKKVMDKEGKKVLFILDGYDELPAHLRHRGILIDLLSGEVLPKASVVVTSRPSATRDLYMTCRPQVQRHVEILGFTDEQVNEYARSVFSTEPALLEDFLLYVSASKNPAINSLMYVPLNAAIIVEIYRNNKEKGSPIPQTMTQLYTQLCLSLLQRHVSTEPDTVSVDIVDFSDLSSADLEHFQKLAQLAYSKFEQQEVVFYSDSVSKRMVHFGLLDSVQALYNRRGISYNFLHLTVQEFLAAYHITRDPNSAGVFQKYGEDPRWNMVWRFVSGLTSFQFFEKHAQCYVLREVEYTQVDIQYLFEAQIQLDPAADKIRVQIDDKYSPLDMYAAGYCLVHSSARISWQVQLQDATKNFNYYIWGLNSNPDSNATIVELVLSENHVPFLDKYPARLSQGVQRLNLVAIKPQSPTRSSLDLPFDPAPPLPSRLQPTMPNLPRSLLASSSLTEFECSGNFHNPLELCDAVFSSSSLKTVYLSLPYFPPKSFARLETNTSITRLKIELREERMKSHEQVRMLSRILSTNRTVECLTWKYLPSIWPHINGELLKDIKQALLSNTVLKNFLYHQLSIIINYLFEAKYRICMILNCMPFMQPA